MLVSASVFETSDVTSAERLPLWSQALAHLCGSLQLDGYESRSIDGRIEAATIGPLKLCRIVASPHRVALPQDWAGPDRHASIKVLLQLRGSSILEQDSQRVTVDPGDCIAYDVSRPHSIVSPTLTEHLVVVIPKHLAAGYDLCLADVGSQRFSACTGIGHVTRELVEASLDEGCDLDSGSNQQIVDLLLGSLRLSLRHAKSRSLLTPRESLLRKARTYIDAHLRDPTLDIENIAAALGCSRRYLHMVFASEGTSVEKYLWSSRLEGCRRELMKGTHEITLTEVAFAWGFSSSSHFSRSFKQRFGMSPSAMLLKHRSMAS